MTTKKIMDYEIKVCGASSCNTVNVFDADVFKYLLTKMNLDEGKILDIGCGGGAYIGKLEKLKPNLDYFGIDISRKAIKIAQEKYKKVNFKVAGADKLPYSNKYFNIVILRQVLEHLEKPILALKEIRRVLNDSGYCYIVVPLEAGGLIINPPTTLTEKFQGHLYHYSKNDLIKMVKKAGFTIDKYYYSGFIFDQIVNYVCLNLYQKLNFPREFSVEGYLSLGGKPTLRRKTLTILINAVNLFKRIEILLIPKFIPGSTLHIITKK